MSRWHAIHGVDFSGAMQAGRATWVATLLPTGREAFELVALSSLETLCGVSTREPALGFLVENIRTSDNALWGLDFPFALPLELFPSDTTWRDQCTFVAAWQTGAAEFGRECVRLARLLGPKLHIRRQTDVEARTPFDCYHYRIIYQTFHGMRDVLAPLADNESITVAPFGNPVNPQKRAVVVEACPSSTLKRLSLPHQNYKQPQGGPLALRRRQTRHAILAGIARFVTIPDRFRRTIMRNPGGDALDAVLAAIGSAHGFSQTDHAEVCVHPRYAREGRIYF